MVADFGVSAQYLKDLCASIARRNRKCRSGKRVAAEGSVPGAPSAAPENARSRPPTVRSAGDFQESANALIARLIGLSAYS